MENVKNISFTKRYILALSIIAILSVLSFFNLEKVIDSQANDGEVINMSGKQRMLSQKVALYSLTYRLDRLRHIAKTMKEIHKKLTSLPMSDEVKRLYYKKPIMLDKRMKKYLSNIQHFADTTDGRSLEYVLENSESILIYLEQATSLYQKEAEEKISKLHKNETYILLLTILTLIIEAFFIFKPANDAILSRTKELIKEKEYSDLVTQTNTNAIIAIDETSKILTFNKSAEYMFGFNANEMLGTVLNEGKIIPKQFLKEHNESFLRFIKTGELKNRDKFYEFVARKKDGTIFPIKMSLGVDTSGEKKIIVANIQDITKQREQESLIIQQSRFAAMGEMIGNIAHQWRQPLSSINMIATGALIRRKNGMLDDSELDETFKKITTHVKYLSDTIEDFRNFFSKKKKDEIFDVNETIKQAAALVEASYNAHSIRLILKLSKEILKLKGGNSELAQVILNILNNAKDALVARNIDERVVVVKTTINNEDKIIIDIFDSAKGIKEDVILKVFEPYFTTKHRSQGTGIGLFMSKQIVEQHFKGSITVKNNSFIVDNKTYSGANFKIVIDKYQA